jgi:glycine cleavage system transcriptional repressor
MAEDRPGIVATVSRTVVEAGGNVDSCSQTVLSGYFTLIMVISFEKELALEEFAAKLTGTNGSEHGLQVMIRPFRSPVARTELVDAENFVVTCFGPDSQGVIYRFSVLLAEKGINIVDLYGYRRDEQFVLISQVQIPRRWDLAMLQADLEQLGRQLGFAVRLQHENIFIATNQLRLGRMSTGNRTQPDRT